jgi:hypothetical protein
MSRLELLTALAATFILIAAPGCSTNVERVDSSAPAAVTTTTSEPATPPVATTAAGPHDERLQEVGRLEAAYRQKPEDASAKSKLIAAKYDYAVQLMEDANVPPMQKYRPALKAFNEILAIDPQHKESAERKQIIEDIYRSMNLPIPR